MSANKSSNINPEDLAKKLHEWYLEALEKSDPDRSDPEVQKAYEKLSIEKKFLDQYIAKKIIEYFDL